MSNLFDSANYPEGLPDALVIGDRWTWKRADLTDYDTSLYTLTYSLRLWSSSSATEIEITASASGSEYHIEVASATTAGYTAGDYSWDAYITRDSDSERITVDRGTVEVKVNRDASTTDPRTHAQIVLEAIEAVIEGRASKDQESYTIGDRSLSRTPLDQLLQFRKEYRAEVRAEKISEGGGGMKLVAKL